MRFHRPTPLAACLLLILLVGLPTCVTGQTRAPQSHKFDEFTAGIGSPRTGYARDYEAERKEIETHLVRYAAELRRAGARPYAITYSPRVLEWEIYNRSIAEMRGGALWEVTNLGADWRQINVVNGGFREVAATELWIVPPGAQPPCPTPTVAPDEVAYCPFVRVGGLPYVPAPGRPIEFKVDVEVNSRKVQPGFTWTVSRGRIVLGQGTDTIRVELPAGTSGDITARVDLVGYSPDCPAGATTAIAKTVVGVDHMLFDEFGNITCEDELARLDNLAVTLQNEPALQVQVVVYGGRVGPRNEALARAARMKAYLVGSRGVEPERVITIDGGYRDELSGELWLSPRGAIPPVTRPTIDRRYVKIRGQVRIVNAMCSYM